MSGQARVNGFIAVSPARSRPRLHALAGLRVVVALQIYLFHLMQAHQAGLLTFGLIDGFPAPLARLIGRGFISTGLFFQLSGLLLAYVYLDRTGRPKVADGPFWRARFIRLYPLYFLLLAHTPHPRACAMCRSPRSPARWAQ